MRGVSLRLFLLLSVSAWGCAPSGSSAYVTYNIPPDGSCIYSPSATNNLFLPEGHYDIAKANSGTFCDRPYFVNLLANSSLRPNQQLALGRAEPNVLQIHDAEVTLKDATGATLVFNRFKHTLPNPFSMPANNSLSPSQGGTPSTGIASFVAIPTDYAQQLPGSPVLLNGAKQGKLLAEIHLFGTTTGNIDIDFKPFTYPIDICIGCLTTCESVVVAAGKTDADVSGKGCVDNAGADGRICIDPGC